MVTATPLQTKEGIWFTTTGRRVLLPQSSEGSYSEVVLLRPYSTFVWHCITYHHTIFCGIIPFGIVRFNTTLVSIITIIRFNTYDQCVKASEQWRQSMSPRMYWAELIWYGYCTSNVIPGTRYLVYMLPSIAVPGTCTRCAVNYFGFN